MHLSRTKADEMLALSVVVVGKNRGEKVGRPMKMTGPRLSRQYVGWRKIPNEVRDDPGVPLLP